MQPTVFGVRELEQPPIIMLRLAFKGAPRVPIACCLKVRYLSQPSSKTTSAITSHIFLIDIADLSNYVYLKLSIIINYMAPTSELLLLPILPEGNLGPFIPCIIMCRRGKDYDTAHVAEDSAAG